MTHTFTQKFLLAVFAGLVAASLFWVFRHVIERALYESSDEGYRETLRQQQEAKAQHDRQREQQRAQQRR